MRREHPAAGTTAKLFIGITPTYKQWRRVTTVLAHNICPQSHAMADNNFCASELFFSEKTSYIMIKEGSVPSWSRCAGARQCCRLLVGYFISHAYTLLGMRL
jgi:hypothetical protein